MPRQTTRDWQNLSEICFGLLVTKKVDPTKFSPSIFIPPYNSGCEVWKLKASLTSVVDAIGEGAVNAAIQAAASTEELEGSVEWHTLLTLSSRSALVGAESKKIGAMLERGETVDTTRLIALAQSVRDLGNPTALGLHPMSEVDENFMPMIETGWPLLDKYFGGIPHTRPLAVGADTGKGKTIFSMHLHHYFLNRWPEAVTGVWTLELSETAWKHRYLEIFPEDRDIVNSGRIMISKASTSAEEIGLEAAAANLKFFSVDYIDYLIKKEISEAAWRQTNLQLNEITRTLEIPALILHQFNSARNVSKVPTLGHFAWGTSNSNVAGLVLALSYISTASQAEEMFAYDERYPMCVFALKNGEKWVDEYQGPGVVCLPRDRRLWASGKDSHWEKLEKIETVKKVRRGE